MTRQQLLSGRHSSGDGSGPVLHSARSFEMMQKMPATLEQTGSNLVTPRSAFILRFISTIGLWTVALLIMFSGYEILFWLLISVFGMIGLWEFYRMLDHKALPNFKITGMICGAVMLAGSFYYFSKIGPAGSYDFEVAVLLFFLLTMFGRQMFARLRHDEPLQTMAYTLFGLLYVLWLLNFTTKILYLTPRSSAGIVTTGPSPPSGSTPCAKRPRNCQPAAEAEAEPHQLAAMPPEADAAKLRSPLSCTKRSSTIPKSATRAATSCRPISPISLPPRNSSTRS